jgi:CheY-like chemotaxis protein
MEQLRRQNEEHTRHAQKMDAVGRLAAGVAHDFNNLLTAMLGNVALARARLPADDPAHELLASAETAAERAAMRVRQLQAFSGHARLRAVPLDLRECLDEPDPVLQRTLGPRVALVCQLADDLWRVPVDRAMLTEVLVGLCLHAHESIAGEGRLVLNAENMHVEEADTAGRPGARSGDFVRLCAREVLTASESTTAERVEEPAGPAKKVGTETSLVLALLAGIVEQHHGWMEVAREAAGGMRFDLYLPRGVEVAPAAPPVATATTRRNGTITILLADDEPMLRDLGRTLLQRQGYQVLLAENGMQALEIFRQERDRIDLVILDLTMPRLSGDDACRQMLEIDPGVRVLFSSGYFPDDLNIADDRVLGFLRKPYRNDELTATVTAALEQVHVPQRDVLLMLVKRLEQVIARGPDDDWAGHVASVLGRVQELANQRAADPEAPDDNLADLETTPYPVHRHIDRLRRKYAEIVKEATSLRQELGQPPSGAEDRTDLHRRLKNFVSTLERHRKAEIDLVQKSVTTEIGAGD